MELSRRENGVVSGEIIVKIDSQWIGCIPVDCVNYRRNKFGGGNEENEEY